MYKKRKSWFNIGIILFSFVCVFPTKPLNFFISNMKIIIFMLSTSNESLPGPSSVQVH